MNELIDREVSGDVVDLGDDYQVSQWTEIYDCSIGDLADAVRTVGPLRGPVKRYLRVQVLVDE